ncbi:MAG: hypothetical protein PHX78_08525 [bacterium]|nr:hypothetical protein [bacterium]
MNQKNLLKILSILFIGIFLCLEAGCKSSSNSTSSSDTSGFQVTSSATNGHTHSVTILSADLASLPAAGATYTSTSSGGSYYSSGHTHTIFLSQQQLTAINSGSTVTVTSSVTESHTHDWVITKS